MSTTEPVEPAASMPTNVIQALARVMVEIPGIGRDNRSEQGYQYRGIEAITAEAQHLLGRYGVVFVPRVIAREVKEFTINSKPWTEDQAQVIYRVYGPGGVEDFIEVGPLYGLGRDNSDKGMNKAMTQAFKYALIQTLCIGDSKDDPDREVAHEGDAPSEGDTPSEHRAIPVPNAKGGLLNRIMEKNPALTETEAKEEATRLWTAAGLPSGREETITQADYDSLLESVGSPPDGPQEPTKAPEPQSTPEPEPGPETAPEPTERPESAEPSTVGDTGEGIEARIRAIRSMKKTEIVPVLATAGLSTAGKLEALQDRLMDHEGLLTAPFEPEQAQAAITHAFPGASQVGPEDVDAPDWPDDSEGAMAEVDRIAAEELERALANDRDPEPDEVPIPDDWKRGVCVCGQPVAYQAGFYVSTVTHLDRRLNEDHQAEEPF